MPSITLPVTTVPTRALYVCTPFSGFTATWFAEEQVPVEESATLQPGRYRTGAVAGLYSEG